MEDVNMTAIIITAIICLTIIILAKIDKKAIIAMCHIGIMCPEEHAAAIRIKNSKKKVLQSG